MLKVRFFLFSCFLTLPCFIGINNSKGLNQTRDINYSLIQVDSLHDFLKERFQPAANSETHLVLSKSDFTFLTDQVNTLILENRLQKNKLDSIELGLSINTSLATTNSDLNLENADLPRTNPSQEINLIITYIFVTLLMVFILILTIRHRKATKDLKDAMTLIEEEFLQHKRNAVERERKLLRDLLDAKLKLEEVGKVEQKKNNAKSVKERLPESEQ